MAKWNATVEEVLLIAAKALVYSADIPHGTKHQDYTLTDEEATTLGRAAQYPDAWLGPFPDLAALALVRHASDRHYTVWMQKTSLASHNLFGKPDIIGDRSE